MTNGGWYKYDWNPVLGGDLGTCFDLSVLRRSLRYRMWFSWRPRKSLALTQSRDGITWCPPQLVLGPTDSGWEDEVNRPVVIRHQGRLLMWYTGQTRERSALGYAASNDGVRWHRLSSAPVLSATEPWEKGSVMCPHVVYDRIGLFRMWYSAGDQYEPDAIGYAESRDGVHWQKHPDNPIFTADPDNPWERHKVTACQVIKHRGWHLMFYIGFEDEHTARIGLARSRDGLHDWHRHPANPIIAPTPGSWDSDACYKPFALRTHDRWLLWYNGRHNSVEQIGLAIHEGLSLKF
jgi:beta-1,2-mannobiose phosphorylase / 1,2-beta-oligomannan phosphorylase